MDPGATPSVPTPAPVEAVPARAEERELIGAILRRDRKAAAQFVAAHIDAVYAYARHRLIPRADLVDDVVQDVFLAALNGLRGFQGQSSLRTWLIGIARHKIDDVYRQRLREPHPLDTSDGDTPETVLDQTTVRRRDRYRARPREDAPHPGGNVRTIRVDVAVAVLGAAQYARRGSGARDDREGG